MQASAFGLRAGSCILLWRLHFGWLLQRIWVTRYAACGWSLAAPFFVFDGLRCRGGWCDTCRTCALFWLLSFGCVGDCNGIEMPA